MFSRAFELCKDAYFVEYMGHNQEAHEEYDIPTPLLANDKILNFALGKYTYLYHINNHIWGSLSKREA